MIVLGVAVLFGAILVGLSLWANARFRGKERLPMQWSLTGTVNWSAPRIVALGFIPVLAICFLAFFVILAMNVRPRAGQEGLVLPMLIIIGGTFVAAYLFHLWMIEKTLRRNGD